jgi:hypothetical protein
MDPGGEERRETRRHRVSLALAGALHALGLLFLAARPSPIVPPPIVPEDVVVELLTEVAVSVPESSTQLVPPTSSLPGAPAVPAGAPIAARRSAAAGAADDPYGDGAVAIDGARAGSGPPVSEAPSAAASPPRDRALPPPLLPLAVRAPLAALAGPLGAVPAVGGEVMVAAQKAAERSGPAQGHGTVRITVEEDGTVSGVMVSGAGWEAAGQGLRAALAGRKLRVAKGAHGAVITLSLNAEVTRVPPVLTGQARAQAVGMDAPHGGVEDNHSGFHPGASNMAVIDPTLLAPLKRRNVRVELVSEQAR